MQKYGRYDNNVGKQYVSSAVRMRERNSQPNTTDPYEMSVWLLNTFNGCKVVRRENESNENLIRRFKKLVEQAGITRELKSREFYMSTAQKKRDKKKKALKRLRKNAKLEMGDDIDPKTVIRSAQDTDGPDNRGPQRRSF